MRIFTLDAEGRRGSPGSLDGVELEGLKVIWIDLESSDKVGLERASGLLGVDTATHREPASQLPSSNVQAYEDRYLFVRWNDARLSDETVTTPYVRIYIGQKFLLTVHSKKFPRFEKLFDDLVDNAVPAVADPARIVFYILDCQVDDYFSLIETIANHIESRLITEKGKDYLATFKLLKQQNRTMRRAVATNRDVLSKLMRRGDVEAFIPADVSRDLNYVYDHLVTVYSEAESNSELITDSLDIHLNVTMKRLTTIATIFMPLTFLVGLYGMNFRHMPELTWRYGYLMAWIALVVIAVVMIVVARKKDWF